MKSLKYWPDNGETMTIGDITIKTVHQDTWSDFTISQLKATKVRLLLGYINQRTFPLPSYYYVMWWYK